MKRIKNLLYLCLLSTAILYAESSSYSFGNNQAVLSAQDKRNISAMKRQIAEQEERIDGLTTIIEGLSESLNALQSKKMNDSSMLLLENLRHKLDKIQTSYVSKDELQKMLTQNIPKKKKEKEKPLKKKSNAGLYSEAVRHFVKKRYAKAEERFKVTEEKGYKPAASNYYLGEIAYYTYKYKDAIFYFKKSAGLYEKASYMDVLLLHTAVSLEKTGSKTQAKAFYENIIENYAGKKSAEIAKKRLKNLTL
ncbi:MAG: hypothetical protein DRQ78_05245 [Epsilonproteobacteria bacterium]|nr:MAG: hypothetical protein DRQ78_05245 [Campylobacterota bacterium]